MGGMSQGVPYGSDQWGAEAYLSMRGNFEVVAWLINPRQGGKQQTTSSVSRRSNRWKEVKRGRGVLQGKVSSAIYPYSYITDNPQSGQGLLKFVLNDIRRHKYHRGSGTAICMPMGKRNFGSHHNASSSITYKYKLPTTRSFRC